VILGLRELTKREADLSLALFIAGGIAGLVQLNFKVDFGPGYEMVAIANNLAHHGTFGNPFYAAHTGPTAVNPPLYPFFLALLTKVLRAPAAIAFVASIAGILLNALTAAWLPRISWLFYGDVRPGAAAAILWLAAAPLSPSWDTSYTVSGLILFCLFSATSIESGNQIIGSGAMTGIVAGLLVLLNPSSLLVSLPWVAHLTARRKATPQRSAKYCCAVLAALFLTVSPWVIRNYYQLGAPVLRTNLGMTLDASHNDCAQSTLIADELNGCYQAHHPNVSVSEAHLLASMGEVAYDRRRVADAKNWIWANPDRFRELTLRRFWEFWFPPAGRHAYTSYVIWLITALSVPGLILMTRRREPVTAFVAAVLLAYPLVYYVVVTDVRYRYPVLWCSLLPAGYWIVSCTLRPRAAALTASDPRGK
jgi:hypothetical protein